MTIRKLCPAFFGALLTACSLVPVNGLDSKNEPSTTNTTAAAFFEAKVRPILVSRCEECHGEPAEGGLRLDSGAALLKGGDSGPAVIPGNPDASLLIQAIRQTHQKLRMPKKRNKLATDELETLEKWVASGAVWPQSTQGTKTPKRIDVSGQLDFWSLRPLTNPPLPSVKNARWPKNDIDRFVLARLEREGMTPVAEASKTVLIRRVSYGLTGLPPTPESVQSFVADTSPGAFETVVDRLLESPQYGETWGRWWLDVARYGEDDCRSLDPMGRGFNPYPNAYLYRDWVVQALNEDLPYDQFILAQLAGDLLGEKGRAGRLPALGFLGLGPWLYDNGSIEVARADERHDRVDTLSRGLLGLTIGCARCHDHKYDAISTEDYYAVASVFKNTTYREYPQVPKSVVDDFLRAEHRVEAKEKLVADFEKTTRRHVSESLALQTSKYMTAAWDVLGEPRKDKALVAAKEKLDYELFDRWLAFLTKPPKHYKYLEKWQALIAARGKKEDAKKLAEEFQETVLDVMFDHIEIEEENDIIRAKALPGTKKKKESKLPSDFVTNDDFCPGCGLDLRTLKGERNSLWIDLFDRDLDYQLDLTQGNFDPNRKPGLFVFEHHAFERHLGAERRFHLQELKDDIKAARKELEPKYPYVHGVADVETPTPIRVHLRGNPFRLGNEVPPRLPELLSGGKPAVFKHGSGRLELAQAIVKHPIAARVLVNRVWKWHFGVGLVETPGDFGRTGEHPSHPELLDYLARHFTDTGMSLKKLHKEILLSATYRLSDQFSESNAAIDGGNRFHWRTTPRRLTAEQIRDSALFVAGSLDLKPGGPSEKLTTLATRRTLYSRISRYKLDPYLALFDFPTPNSTAERRFTTQVPLQRLFLMNSDFMQQQAESLGRRVAVETNSTARIQKLYSLLFNRPATDSELASAKEFLASEPMKSFEERKQSPTKPPLDSKEPSASSKPPEEEDEAKTSGPGMMAGVANAGTDDKPEPKILPATLEGRYIKILMSSHEFLFVR